MMDVPCGKSKMLVVDRRKDLLMDDAVRMSREFTQCGEHGLEFVTRRPSSGRKV